MLSDTGGHICEVCQRSTSLSLQVEDEAIRDMPSREYLVTKKRNTAQYTGVTSQIEIRIRTHQDDPSGFVKRYKCHYCVYYEVIHGMTKAILHVTEIKGWKRAKKSSADRIIEPGVEVSE